MKKDYANTCILGEGLTGLSTAYHWPDDDYLVLEKGSQVGGSCRTEVKDDFSFDSGGHIFYPKQEYTRELVHKLLGETLREADREARIYSYGVYTRYPFQANLYGLPAEVVAECLEGLHEAKLREARDGEVNPSNFLDFIYRTFGEGIARSSFRGRWTSLFIVNVAVDRPSLTEKHRMYSPIRVWSSTNWPFIRLTRRSWLHPAGVRSQLR